MIVYGTSISPFARKVLFFIGEKGLQTVHMPVAPHDASPEFKAASPFGKIPAFSDGDYHLSDSSAICHYLEKQYPSRPLFPADAKAYGRVVWYDEFCDTILGPSFGKVFFNLFVKPKMLQQQPDMEVVQQGLDELAKLQDFLESQINGPFLVGDDITMADISISCPFFNLGMVGHAVDAAKWPKLTTYLAGIHSRPAFMTIKDQRAEKQAA